MKRPFVRKEVDLDNIRVTTQRVSKGQVIRDTVRREFVEILASDAGNYRKTTVDGITRTPAG